ncbi:MAG: hypothetical protein Tp152DCM46671_52 [Prokaryotic dsDNA virus sp.]|nr:MAG: hypothetical protein Tp152DCM46671_52 [Prokaryotic dsDNA virus sp.]|tara:strand:- start:42578 stop:42949 length:372 start_codon:yes stop_codon:yes gene_type:complete
MANEIKVSISITAEKNGAKFTRSESFMDDMTGDAWSTGIVDVAEAGTQLTELDVGTYGWVFVKNLGTDNAKYVDIQHTQNTADDSLCRLYGGESTILKTAALTALWGDSSSGTQAVEYAIIEL